MAPVGIVLGYLHYHINSDKAVRQKKGVSVTDVSSLFQITAHEFSTLSNFLGRLMQGRAAAVRSAFVTS